MTTKDAGNRSPLNNRSNVLSKEEFYQKARNRNLYKQRLGKENADKKGLSRVLRKSVSTVNNEKPSRVLKHETPEKSNPTVAKVLTQPNRHRRSISAGNLDANELKAKSNSLHPSKKSTLKKYKSSEKLNGRLSLSVDGLNTRKSVSADKINSKLSSSSKGLHGSLSNSANSLNSEKSDTSSTLTFNKPSGVPKIKSNLVPSASRIPTNSNAKHMSTADLELQKIEEKRQEALAAKKLSEKSFKKSLHSKGYVPVNSGRKLTVTKVFEFKSDKRLRTRSADYVKSPVTDLAQILRKDNLHHHNKPPKMTVVQPFKLSQCKKVENVGNYQTVAEQVRNFSKKTPERFRTRSRDSKPQKAWSPPRCTIPKTPNFTSSQRSRPLNLLSTKEKEEKEIEEIQKYKFKAKEVDKKIFQTRIGIKEVPKKEATVVVPFDLPGSKVPTTKKEIPKENYVFHARPLPTGILEGVLGVKPVEAPSLTVPESPAFALKQRTHRFATQQQQTQEPVIRKIKARPYVHYGIQFEPKLEHRCITAEPFTFDEKMKENQMKKEQKIQKLIEESKKVTEFTANPIPDYSNTGLPPKKMPTTTKLAPFKLHIEERVEKRIEEKQQQLEDEMKLQQEKMKFKAQPCEVVKKPPFMPQLDHKCTQEREPFELSTEARSAQRTQFEEQKKAREAELMSMRLEAERLKQDEEEREIQRLRQEAVHKANPIKHYKPVQMQHGSQSVTIPVTPKFATKSRVRTNESINCDE